MMIRKLPLGFAAFALAMAAAPSALAQNDQSPTATGSVGAPAATGTVTVVGPTAAAPTAAPTTTTTEPKKDDAKKDESKEEKKEPKVNPFRGSMILFDQSMLVNSFDRGAQLSYTPEYDLWLSPRLYYTYEKHWKFGARFDFFYEPFTNHEDTTYAHEWRWGDPWLTASYSDKASFINNKSRWSLGLLGRPPMSRESIVNGQYFAIGPTGSFTYGFDVNKGSNWFSGGSIGLSAVYSHAFSRSTTPNSMQGYQVPAADLNGLQYLDNQIRSNTLVGDTFLYAINADLEIHDDLSFSASMIWIDQFAYTPPAAAFDSQTVARSPLDSHFRQLSWFLVDFDYNVIPELTLSLGYYNLNTVLAPDSTYRNPFGSPESRLFFSMTANLDALYSDATREAKKPSNTAKARVNPIGIF